MTLDNVATVISAVLLLFGSFLVFAAGVGVARFSDLLTRMHPAAKPQVLGLMLVLVGAGLQIRDAGNLWILVLIIAFQLLTSPVSAHMVGQAGIRTGAVDKETLLVNELTTDREAAREQERNS